ncbi:MAG TPA: hypothetical protein DCM23_01830 [Firmicutes bacterium]|nr:hypothetical protein [Bacillota bacterium]
MKAIELLLEFPLIQRRLISYSHTSLGTKRLNDLGFLGVEELKEHLQLVDEMMSLIIRYGALPILNSQILEPYFVKAQKGAALNASEIHDIYSDLQTIGQILSFFKGKAPSYPNLSLIINRLTEAPTLSMAIEKVLAPDLSIKDSASPLLNKLRHQKRSLEQKMLALVNKLTEQYQSVLSDKQAVVRNGHMVLPVLTQEKQRVEGIIHAMSDTGYTTFIEPTPLVMLNNELYVLTQQEIEEIHRILLALTQEILLLESPLLANNDLLALLDVIGAKAQYGNAINGFVGQIKTDRIINLFNARHPLIDQSVVVPNSFYLNEDKRLVIITGPNAGGKTVAMKTVGLLVYMHQCGIPLPTDRPAELSYFDHIYADIGDSQSLMDHLSTFAGHIANLATIVTKVTRLDLVLIDELGTGTDPQEGEALAVAVLRYLAQKQAFVIVSSHFAMLKQLGFSEPGMRNASMRFDEKKLTPTYELVLDTPGRSYGLEMAYRYGLDETIINQAETIMASNQATASKLIDDLQRELDLQREKSLEMANAEQEIKARLNETLMAQEKINQAFETLKADFAIERAKLVAEATRKANEAVAALSNPHLKLHEAIAIKRNLEATDDIEQPPTILEGEPISIGDYAIYEQLGLRGKVISITKKGATIVTNDGKTIKVNLDNLKKTEAPIRSEQTKIRYINRNDTRVPLELNLIGQRVDEALNNLDQYIDSALASNVKRVRIIHGLGTGALRKAVTNYLQGKPYVASFRDGEQGEGGAGATVVFFK